MAEAAGLVLGGVALVGLVSTCVEISEYLESAKNRSGDVELALTKVNLIKQRLDDWGAARAGRPADMPPDPPSNHTTDPATCGVLLLTEETLKRIKILLDKTNRMSGRHGLRSPIHQRHLRRTSYPSSRIDSFDSPCRSHSVTSGTRLPSTSGASPRACHPRVSQVLLSLPLKVLRVLQDRRRFDNIIEHLDFLLSSLEKISETLQKRREMAQNRDRRARDAIPPDRDASVDSGLSVRSNADHESLEKGSPRFLDQNSRGRPSHKQPAALEANTHPTQTAPGSLSPDQGSKQMGSQLYENFRNNKAKNDAAFVQGDVGFEQPTGSSKRNFEGNEAEDRALQIMGDVSSSACEQLMNRGKESTVTENVKAERRGGAGGGRAKK